MLQRLPTDCDHTAFDASFLILLVKHPSPVMPLFVDQPEQIASALQGAAAGESGDIFMHPADVMLI